MSVLPSGDVTWSSIVPGHGVVASRWRTPNHQQGSAVTYDVCPKPDSSDGHQRDNDRNHLCILGLAHDLLHITEGDGLVTCTAAHEWGENTVF